MMLRRLHELGAEGRPQRNERDENQIRGRNREDRRDESRLNTLESVRRNDFLWRGPPGLLNRDSSRFFFPERGMNWLQA